jgi:hypothetical protein
MSIYVGGKYAGRRDFMTYLHLLTVVGGIDDVKAKAAQLAKEMS